MAGFGWLSHKVEYHLIFRKITVKIHFHPAFMQMSGHCVPHIIFRYYRISHSELTTLHDFGVNILIYYTKVAFILRSKIYMACLFNRNFLYRKVHKRGGTVVIELCWIAFIFTLKAHLFFSAPHVQTVPVVYIILFATHLNKSRAADVKHTKLPFFKKKLTGNQIARGQ